MAITNFVWDDLSDNVLMETDENNVPVAKYTNEPNPFGEVLSQHRHGQDQYFHFDGLGSTRNLTAQNETVSDSYVYTAFGETVASSGSTPNPFKYNGAFGYYTNTETNDIYVRRRTYAPTIARWLSRDPLEFVDGPNVYFYIGNQVPNGVDPSGTDWRKVGSTIYEAEGEEDSLMSLAWKITQNNDDWVCIWPIRDKNLWSGYPWAKPCAKADVRNLVAKPDKSLFMRQSYNEGDMFMQALDRFMGDREKVWTSGNDAAEKIANRSGQGKTPLGLLFVGGHNFNGNSGTSIGNNQGGPEFSAANIFEVAQEKNNRKNTYNSAVERIGPPRCWFTREGEVYGFACNTHSGWTTDWANKVMRATSTAKGAEPLVYAEFSQQPLTSSAFTRFDGTQDRYFNVSSLLSSPHWKSVPGTQ